MVPRPAGGQPRYFLLIFTAKKRQNGGGVELKRTVIFLTLILLVTQNLYAQQADTEYIPASKYFDTTLVELNNARSSIQVFMYLVSVFPDQPDSQSNQLLNALIKAKERGVDVKVILDQNMDFQEETSQDALQNKNQAAFEQLHRNNIPVFFDTADTYTHAKAIVIDNETVLLGSTNWSKAALTRNNETNALIRSKEFAAKLLDDMSKIQIQEVPAVITPTVQIPKVFLTDNKLLGEMVSQADERAFDTYLYLLSLYDGNAESTIALNYDNLAKSLAIDNMTKEDYRRQINKVLDKLQDKYKLIKFKNPERNQDAEITLNKSESSNSVSLPTTYWRYGWNKTLSFPAKAMYLINLSNTQTSPTWFMARENIAKTYQISESFISDGTRQLREKNLLNVKYGELEGKSYDERQANEYTPEPIYNPEDLAKELKTLDQKYGQDKVARAKQTAAIVFEGNNLKTIQVLIDLETQYGQTTIQEATQKLAGKNPDNPKRSAGYLINTIKGMAADNG